MTEGEAYRMAWARRAAEAVGARLGSDEAHALARVARDLLPLELVLEASLEPGFAWVFASPEARTILRIPEGAKW